MKIILLNPPFLNKYSKSSRSPAVTKSGTIYFPLWLSYAAGVLDKAGHELKLIDAPAKCLDKVETLTLIKEFSPKLIVIDTSTPSISNDLEFAKEIKQTLPNCKVCLVGTHASACVDEILKENSFIDFIARREYDYTLRELAEKLENPELYGEIAGISYIMNNNIVNNPDREYIHNLDELPFVSEVYKKYLDIKDYFYAHVSYPTISIFSSRGCPSKCFYCMYSQVMFGKSYRKRSAKNLFDECVYITKNFPEVKEILIDDDNFAVDQENIKEFCNLMIKTNIKLKWTVQVRVNLKYETMILMKKAGCKLLVAGFESGNQQILDNMHKGITLEQSLRFNEDAKKAKLRVHGCFMVGNPGETKETMMETLEFAKKLKLDTVQFFPLMIYPGTEAYNWAKKNNFIEAKDYREWLKEDGMHNCILSTDNIMSQEFVDFCNYARKRFYLRPSYIFMKLVECLTSKDDAVRTMKAFGTFRKYLFSRG
ncbi:B12-binding domain-containing radical SAM protein [Clostridium sp. JS66]|uniref:B12-binding domain-containing radical SAM protein n=1 Tax=Clostridium sp. JS66 TaxID=3064705 RepID=UPI00298D7A4B|nr:radical SAM protein [Clostridium sp. JS66]WPC43282.1 radical SAM protein [Clostridium sp. JS66]